MESVPDIMVAYYNSRHAEIQTRTNLQHGIVTITMGGVAAIVAAAYSHTPVHGFLLFVIPIFLPIMGLFYLDHAIGIQKLASEARAIYNPRSEPTIHSKSALVVYRVVYIALGLIWFAGPGVLVLLHLGWPPWGPRDQNARDLSWLGWASTALFVLLWSFATGFLQFRHDRRN
ncbi:MAG TPA: hypothetical protein VMF91_21290 [Bryobacteraceae bacterium]|nr:hypothetical protein [Bryobacteraceae bacterium]